MRRRKGLKIACARSEIATSHRTEPGNKDANKKFLWFANSPVDIYRRRKRGSSSCRRGVLNINLFVSGGVRDNRAIRRRKRRAGNPRRALFNVMNHEHGTGKPERTLKEKSGSGDAGIDNDTSDLAFLCSGFDSIH
jgi:hypothetical protein